MRAKSCKSRRLFPLARLEVPFHGAVFSPQHTSKFVCIRLNENVVVFEPLLDVEAGAGTVGELVVAVDGGDGVFFHQVTDELEEGEALGFGAGVGGATVGIEAADIGDADALGVVTWAMGTDLFDGTARADAAIMIDDIMIADVVPAETLMVAADALDGAVGIGSGGGAVDDDFGDCSHFFVGLMGLMGLMGELKGSKPTARGAVGLLG